MSCDANFFFSIDGHNLTVIEADSHALRPSVVDSIQMFAGQRYSVVVDAKANIGNYWVRSLPSVAVALNYTGMSSPCMSGID
jgi:iron transport multicopper oxidase